MKKILLWAGVASFLFASCCSNKEKCETTDEQNVVQNEEHKCCKEMTEEQKQACADWENWANIDDARKEVLLNDVKVKYDQRKVEREEKMAKMAEFDAKMTNWEQLSLDEKKALCDEMKSMCKGKHGHGEGEMGGCKGNHKHEGCKGKHAEEGCKKNAEKSAE